MNQDVLALPGSPVENSILADRHVWRLVNLPTGSRVSRHACTSALGPPDFLKCTTYRNLMAPFLSHHISQPRFPITNFLASVSAHLNSLGFEICMVGMYPFLNFRRHDSLPITCGVTVSSYYRFLSILPRYSLSCTLLSMFISLVLRYFPPSLRRHHRRPFSHCYLEPTRFRTTLSSFPLSPPSFLPISRLFLLDTIACVCYNKLRP